MSKCVWLESDVMCFQVCSMADLQIICFCLSSTGFALLYPLLVDVRAAILGQYLSCYFVEVLIKFLDAIQHCDECHQNYHPKKWRTL